MLQTDVVIIGAGIAGLMAATWLKEHGRSVHVIEKEAVVGGRMATWEMENGRADVGAQFFTVRSPVFQEYVSQWLDDGLVFVWSHGWSDGSAADNSPDGFPRYVAHGGMTAVPRHLAQNIPVHTQTTITTIQNQADGWQIVTAAGTQFQSKALILTPPAPQSLALLDACNVPLSTADRASLASITYAPCWSAVLHINGDMNLPQPGAVQRPNDTIGWLADNVRKFAQQKGISSQLRLITMHIDPEKSALWFDYASAEIEQVFLAEIRPYLLPDSTIQSIETHRWPFALPTSYYPQRTLIATALPPLAFAGDAFKEPRVEGAALSGLAAAETIHNLL